MFFQERPQLLGRAAVHEVQKNGESDSEQPVQCRTSRGSNSALLSAVKGIVMCRSRRHSEVWALRLER